MWNKDVESIPGKSELAGRLKKTLDERMPVTELSHQLGSEGDASKNAHNRTIPKILLAPCSKL